MNNIEYYHYFLLGSSNNNLNILYLAPLEVPYYNYNNTNNQIVMGGLTSEGKIISTKTPKSSYNPDTNIGLWEFDPTDFDYRYYANMGAGGQVLDFILVYFLGNSFYFGSENLDTTDSIYQTQNSLSTVSSITFSNNWEYIEFYDSILDVGFFTNLESITLPNNLKGINLNLANSKVKKITLPVTVKEVRLDGELITTILWNASLAEITASSLHLPKLTSIIFGPEVKIIPANIVSYGTPLLENITIPGTVQTIETDAFSDSNIKTINIENGVRNIGLIASNCPHLTSLIIPKSVVNHTFYAWEICASCESLTSVTIDSDSIINKSSSMHSVRMHEKFGPQVTEYIIGNNVKNINKGVFAGCSSLTSINVDAYNSKYSSADGVLFNKDKTTLSAYPGGKQGAYTIPNSVTSIGDEAFRDCSSLTSVTIPNSVTSIGWAAFYDCKSLTSINYVGTIEEWSSVILGHIWHDNVPATYIQCTDGQITISE